MAQCMTFPRLPNNRAAAAPCKCAKIPAMNAVISLEQLYTPINDALGQVRTSVEQLWIDALQLVGIDIGAVPKAGGKMLRPALCLMSAGAIGAKDLSSYVQLATAFEALHIASLAHDDVIDRALLRRGKPSLSGMWDNHAAVLGGDYLVARAVEILATYNSCPVISNAISSVRRMAEGELYFFNRRDEPYRQEDCIMLARQKTASLFAEAVSAPAYILNAAYKDALHGFGIALGIAFQIVDDLLDVTQPSSQMGKPACGDIVEGKKTIPIMHLREGLDAAGLARIDALRDGTLSDDDQAWVAEMAERTGARERTEALAREYTSEAVRLLGQLPPSEYRDAMENLTEFVLVRAL